MSTKTKLKKKSAKKVDTPEVVKKTAKSTKATKGTKVSTKSAKTSKALDKKVAKKETKAPVKRAVKEVPIFEETTKETSISLVKNPEKWQPIKPEWPVPSDFKPHHLLVEFTTDEDGMLARGLKAVRYVGAIEEDKDPRKMFDLATYDPETLTAIAARLGMVTFHSTGRPNKAGISPRLPANTTFRLHIRVSKVKGDLLKATINKIFAVTKRKGKEKVIMLGKTDPAYRKIRSINRHLAAAFVNVMAPPARTRASRRKEADDE